MEICRFGCPDHCQSPAEYVAREQLEVSTSLNNKRQISQNPNLRNPFLDTKNYRLSYQQQQPVQQAQALQQQHQTRRTALPPPPPVPAEAQRRQQLQSPNVAPLYQPDPKNTNAAAASPSLSKANNLPPPPPVPAHHRQQQQQQQIAQSRVAQLPGAYEHGDAKKSPSNGLFGDLVSGLKLPELPKLPSFPFFGGGGGGGESEKRAQTKGDFKSKGEAFKISLGPKPKIEVNDANSNLLYENFDPY